VKSSNLKVFVLVLRAFVLHLCFELSHRFKLLGGIHLDDLIRKAGW